MHACMTIIVTELNRFHAHHQKFIKSVQVTQCYRNLDLLFAIYQNAVLDVTGTVIRKTLNKQHFITSLPTAVIKRLTGHPVAVGRQCGESAADPYHGVRDAVSGQSGGSTVCELHRSSCTEMP